MSETVPTSEVPISADHAELALLEAKTAKKKFEIGQNENFGKYDEFIGPLNSGIDSHDSYHAQRPSDGVIREGDTFRNAESGKFASPDDYSAQNGSTNEQPLDYYDKVNGVTENIEYIAPDYENMNVPQLALATAKAEMIGDKAEVDDIKAIVEHLLMEAATHPDSDMTDKDYNDEIARFNHLVELAKAKVLNKTDGESVAAEATPAEPETAEAGSDTKEAEKATVPEHKQGDKAELNGANVVIESTFLGSNGKIAYEVTKPDGTTELVYADKLTFPAEKTEEESATERLKLFWKKSSNFIKEKLTLGYMSAKWAVEDSIINRGVDPLTTSFEDVEKIRNRNRIYLVAGTAAVIVAAIILKETNPLGHLFGGGDLAGSVPGSGSSGSETLSAHDQNVFDSMHPDTNGVETATPVDQQLPVVDVAPDPAYTIPSGEGGLELFQKLNIDTSKWGANAESFLNRFPQDFYRMNSGGIGISHQGILSQGAQDAINALRN